MTSNQKARTLSDTTESGASEAEASTSQLEGQDLPLMDIDTEHTITLSVLDQGMPRHYTRFCLAFRLGETPPSEAISRLEAFFRRTFQAQPWLAGYACPVKEDSPPKHKLEIRFSQRDVERFRVKVQELSEDKCPLTYDELCELGMPPSKIPRELVSSCPEKLPDVEPAPIFDVTVNIIRGGLLVAIFLHHGVTDGASMGTIISGQLCRDITETRPLNAVDLAGKARAETLVRAPLSSIPSNQSIGTHLEYKSALRALGQTPSSPLRTPSPSEVTSHIFHFSDSTLQSLKSSLNSLVAFAPSPTVPWITTHDALQSLLWQHLTRARIPSLDRNSLPQTSTLLIPVNIRKRITPALSPTYLGGAVALAPATLPLSSLLPQPPLTRTNNHLHPHAPNLSKLVDKAYLLSTAITIHTAIARVNDAYLREVLALTTQQGSVRRMVDINVETAGGLDICITSWAVLPVFDSDDRGEGNGKANSDDVAGMGMGLGLPDFVRKPWSRDAGGCIILPRDRRRSGGGLEVLVQLKTEDMERLTGDGEFMGCVSRVID